MSADTLVLVLTAATAITPDTMDVQGSTLVQAKSRLRAEPRADGELVLELTEPTSCQALGRTTTLDHAGQYYDFWYDVDCDGTRGWVFGWRTSRARAANSGQPLPAMPELAADFEPLGFLVADEESVVQLVGRDWLKRNHTRTRNQPSVELGAPYAVPIPPSHRRQCADTQLRACGQ